MRVRKIWREITRRGAAAGILLTIGMVPATAATNTMYAPSSGYPIGGQKPCHFGGNIELTGSGTVFFVDGYVAGGYAGGQPSPNKRPGQKIWDYDFIGTNIYKTIGSGPYQVYTVGHIDTGVPPTVTVAAPAQSWTP